MADAAKPSSPAKEPKPCHGSPLVVNNWYDVKITNVNSPSNFGVQLFEREETIDHIQQVCQKYGPIAEPVKDLEIGKLCLAKFAADRQWYRAFIRDEKSGPGLASVYFVDFGNTDDCRIKKDLKECPPEILKFLPQVIECKLAGANPSGLGMDSIIDALDALIDAEKYVKAQVVGIADFAKNSAMLITQGEGEGPVVLSIPELGKIGTDSNSADKGHKMDGDNKAFEAARPELKVPVNRVTFLDITHDTAELQNLNGFGKSDADHVDGFKSVIAATKPHEENSVESGKPTHDFLLKTLTDLELEIRLLKQQVENMDKKDAVPKVRKMTQGESAARIQECKTESTQRDKKIRELFSLLSDKDMAIKNAAQTFLVDMEKMEKRVQEKDEELATLREKAKTHCL
jgi:hypothetical protein